MFITQELREAREQEVLALEKEALEWEAQESSKSDQIESNQLDPTGSLDPYTDNQEHLGSPEAPFFTAPTTPVRSPHQHRIAQLLDIIIETHRSN